MDCEKLIAAVRRYELLYDMGNSKYGDMQLRDEAWRKIGKELKQPAVYCKQKWHSLRDGYRKVLRKRRARIGHGATPTATTMKKWRFEEEISFIANFLVERKSSARLDLSTGEESNDSTPIKYEMFTESGALTDEQSSNTYAPEEQLPDNYNGEVTRMEIEKLTENMRDEEKTQEGISASAAAIIMSRLLEGRSKHTEKPLDDMDNFFLNMSSTVKKFPPYLQAITKNKIFKLVSDIEIQQLLPPSFTSSQTITAHSPGTWNGERTPDL